EGGEETVAGLLDHLPAALDDMCAHELVVLREQLPPPLIAQRLEQLRRVDDVREEKGPTRLDAPEKLLGTLLVELRSEPLERRQCSLQFECRAVFVALVANRDPEQEPCVGYLVRRADLLPSVTRVSEVMGRAIPVLLGELDLPEREVDDRVERRRAPIADLVGVDEPLELGGGRAGGRDIGRCQG